MTAHGPTPTCERCGAPAIVHIRLDASDPDTVHHLCLNCADAETAEPYHDGQRDPRLVIGALLVVVGLMVLIISVGADFFAFGRGTGFGWKQMAGVVCGAVLLFVGTILRAESVAVVGLIMAGITFLADYLGFGSTPGFGGQQLVGTILGAALTLAGLAIARKRAVVVGEGMTGNGRGSRA